MTCSSSRYSVSTAIHYRNNRKTTLGILTCTMPTPKSLTPDQVARYARHLILPEVGGAGQRKLLGSSVLLLGAGGRGSPASMYLASVGVGMLCIVDFYVDVSPNGHGQLMRVHDCIAQPMAGSAALLR